MTQLVKYEAACRALAECKAVDEVKAWADKAAAMQAYGRMAKDKTLEVDAAEIRLRAERRLGELIGAQKAGPGLSKGGRPAEKTGREQRPVSERPTLADAGISKDLSSRAQKLAAVPEAEFEAEVGEWRERVSAEGARVSARLQEAGERELKKQPAIQEPEDFGPTAEEIAEAERAQEEEVAAMRKVVESDDKLAAAMAEINRLNALNRVLQERVNGLMNEKAEAIKAAKRWQRKAEAAEKAAA